MSPSKRDNKPLVIGGEPRIDFLPIETKQRKENRRKRRSLVALVIMIAVVCVLGYYSATALALQSQIQLEAEQARTRELLAEQQEYVDVRNAVADLRVTSDARLVGSATEILWSDYFFDVLNVLPEGSVVTALTIDSQSALELAPEVSVLLQNPRVATLFLTISAPDLTVADAVLENLREVPAFADVTATTVELDEGTYTMSVVLNVNSDAFERRFFEEEPTTDDSTEN